MNNKHSGLKTLLLWAGMIAMCFITFKIFTGGSNGPQELSFSEFKAAVEADKIKSVIVESDGMDVAGEFRAGGNYKTNKEKTFNLTDFITTTHKSKNIVFAVKPPSSGWSSILISLLPMALLVIVFLFFMRGMGNKGKDTIDFGKAKTYELQNDTITFDDVAGIDEVKEELEEVVEFLKKPKKFSAVGAKIPKGVLLSGSPGVGKTLLARAVAGEASVPFLSINGSEFVQMFVGVGASRVRDLFEQAKKRAPCIVFIDEIDAVGRQRGAGLGGGNDEREQTLNQILAEMDGFKSNSGIIIIAASNRPDVLDAALLRPGRFDRKVHVPRPDVNGRFAILKVHTKDKTLEESTDLMVIARGTPGATGADLANIINEAALLAARENKSAIGMSHIERAKDKISMGKERRIVMPAEEIRNTAIHESGHAIVMLNSKNADPLHKVSIIPRGSALGVTLQLPVDDRYSISKVFILDFVKILLGGRAAEEICLSADYITTGAQNDLERATELLNKFVAKYGMDEEFGLAAFGDSGSNPFLGREMALHSGMSQGTQEEIEKRTRVLLKKYYEETKKIINDKKNDVRKLTEALLEKETLSVSEIKEILGIEQ